LRQYRPSAPLSTAGPLPVDSGSRFSVVAAAEEEEATAAEAALLDRYAFATHRPKRVWILRNPWWWTDSVKSIKKLLKLLCADANHAVANHAATNRCAKSIGLFKPKYSVGCTYRNNLLVTLEQNNTIPEKKRNKMLGK